MTNGEKIQQIIPSVDVIEITDKLVRYVRVERRDEHNRKSSTWIADVNIDWWNAEYQEPITRSDCAKQNGCITCSLDEGDDCCRKLFEESMQELMVTPQESVKCKWIKYDYRTMCPKEHIDVDNPYWRIPENRMETLKYCPYCGKEIEVEL